MTAATMALMEYLRNIGKEQDADFLREGIRVLTQTLMEEEVSQQIGAERYQRSAFLRTIFTQPSRAEAELQWQQVYDFMLIRCP